MYGVLLVLPLGCPDVKAVEYKPTQYSQRIVVLNEADYNQPWHVNSDEPTGDGINRNKLAPWARAGGLPNDCYNQLGVYLPGKIRVYTRYVQIPLAPRPLPKHSWVFPEGTIFVDKLMKGDKCFEVRMKEKTKDTWINKRYTPTPQGEYKSETYTTYTPPGTSLSPEILNINRVDYRVRRGKLYSLFHEAPATYVDDNLIPRNYFGPGLNCNTCHEHAGSVKYGIALRGGDEIFSFSPFIEGTYTLRNDFPCELEK